MPKMRRLVNGPGHGMSVCFPPPALRGSGVAVQLLDDAGYALYSYCPRTRKYYYEETVPEHEMEQVSPKPKKTLPRV